jgi:hypothetical protein
MQNRLVMANQTILIILAHPIRRGTLHWGGPHRIIGPRESPLCTGRLLLRCQGLEPEAGEPAGLDPLAEESFSLTGLCGAYDSQRLHALSEVDVFDKTKLGDV